MRRSRVLLSEASSLTAREFVTVLGRCGVDVEAVSPASAPLARFSRWCHRVHRAPAPSVDPIGYLQRVDGVLAAGRFDALLATHEQAWLFAAGRTLLPHATMAIAELGAFEQVQSKTSFAALLDQLGLPQPQWRLVETSDDLSALDFPVWVKAAYSTAGRGVVRAENAEQARAAWTAMRTASDSTSVMIQQPAEGRYAQVQGLFDHGRLVAAAVSELLATGAGGSAAARVSVGHPLAVDALTVLGDHLGWHGGITLDYLHVDGRPAFIECNPRTVEPGNAWAAGVDLPGLTITLAQGGPLPPRPQIARPGIRTRSTMAIALGTAEARGTRRAILSSIGQAVATRGVLHGTTEVLTPVLPDPPSLIPFGIATGTVLTSPSRVATLAAGTVETYAVTPAAVDAVRRHAPTDEPAP